jgi:hypothetical protein
LLAICHSGLSGIGFLFVCIVPALKKDFRRAGMTEKIYEPEKHWGIMWLNGIQQGKGVFP